jgi:hypothetical protein
MGENRKIWLFHLPNGFEKVNSDSSLASQFELSVYGHNAIDSTAITWSWGTRIHNVDGNDFSGILQPHVTSLLQQLYSQCMREH